VLGVVLNMVPARERATTYGYGAYDPVEEKRRGLLHLGRRRRDAAAPELVDAPSGGAEAPSALPPVPPAPRRAVGSQVSG
jgi:hypothetical protein